MRVLRGVDNLPEFNNGALTIGTFDGVHSGHQEIIRRVNRLAAAMDGESIILTFHPHPRKVLHPEDESLRLLNTLEEKIALLEKYGVDNLIITPFSDEFSKLTAQAYVEDFLWKKIHPRKVVIGYDHRFGNNRSGDITLMRILGEKLGFDVEEIEAQMVEDISVSSTKIRNALLNGEIESANALLGHRYSLTGKVARGEQNGRQLGFPTANITVRDKEKLIPGNGVYAVKAVFDDKAFSGMMNIGIRPTLNGTHRTIEAHLFDFDADIYGREITIEPVAFIRKEQKFMSLDALKEQLGKDKNAALKLLSRISFTS